MDLEGTDDEMSQISQHSNSLDSYDSGEDDFEYRLLLEGVIVRVPLSLLHILAATAQKLAPGYTRYDFYLLNETWMKAIAQFYPDTPLSALRATDPSLLPRWLLERGNTEDWTVLQPGGIFACCDSPKHSHDLDAESILAADLQCRFRKGFASEGMLCNNPPIPLRVLDFLEHAEDLLNLALVCKATHQAGHVLLQREFRPHKSALLAFWRRKESMLQSAMRHPIPNTTASTSTPALKTGTCSGADAEEPDHLCEFLAVWPKHDCMEQLVCLLLRVVNSPEPDPMMLLPPINQVDPPLPDGMFDWHGDFSKRFPIVMDGETVKRAAAMLEDFDVGPPDAPDQAHRRAREVMRIVLAAKREGQGLILLGRFFTEYEYERMNA